MSKYSRKDNRIVYLPGYGKIGDDRVIEGDYDKYVPSVLIRLADTFTDDITKAVTKIEITQLHSKTEQLSPIVSVISSSVERAFLVTDSTISLYSILVPLTTLEELEMLEPTKTELDELAQMTQDMGGYPELTLSSPQIVTELPAMITTDPVTVSIEPVVESENERPAMATRDQAAAVVAKMKKPRR